MSFTPYTTPTPLPNRPDWNKTDWVEYFKGNHPNFWFKEQLEKNKTIELEKEPDKAKNISGNSITWLVKKTEENEALINGIKIDITNNETTERDKPDDSTKLPSKFFADPLNPQPSEWLDWPPEKWLEWSESDEYQKLYKDPKNAYNPSGVKQPEHVPAVAYKDKQPILITKWTTPQPYVRITEKEGDSVTPAPVVSKGQRLPPPESNFPRATASPTRDPSYLYRKDFVQKSPHQAVQSHNVVQDIRPLHLPQVTEGRNTNSASLASDYLYNEGFESSQLPRSDNRPLSNLAFDRYKDRDTGAINPTLLLLTKKPFQYKKDSLPAAEGYNPLNRYQGQFSPDPAPLRPNQQSFQEGASPTHFSGDRDRFQGSPPVEGSPQSPQSRPQRPSRPSQPLRRPPQFRPQRPGEPGVRRPDFQTQFRNPAENLPNLPPAPQSPDVFLPPIDPNNPNFQPVYTNPTPGIPQNPYYPPPYPYQFPNQYPPQAQGGASSSTSTSTGGGGAGASAASSAGHSSSSSTSVSNGGNSNNDNKYYECTGPDCDRVQVQAQPLRDREQDRNVFFQDVTTSTTTTTTTRAPNFLENITLPDGNQAINLNIPPGVEPPSDLQEAIDRGGNINVNCDRINVCSTLIPPSERLATTTTATTARPPAFQISFGPLFGNRRQPQTEPPSGTDSGEDVVETEELPRPGLGNDIIDEVFNYEKEPDKDLEPISAFNVRPSRPSSNRVSGFPSSDRVASLSRPDISNNRVSFLPDVQALPSPSLSSHRVAAIPTEQPENSEGSQEDLKSIVKALSGLIQILNKTNKGKRRKTNLVTRLPPIGHKEYPVKNIIFDDAATFSQIKSHNLHGSDTFYFNVKHPLSTSLAQATVPPNPRTTIPPHLIPLGPNGSPLVKPDGSFIDPSRSSLPGRDGHLSQMFPYLKATPKPDVTLAPFLRPRTTTQTSIVRTTAAAFTQDFSEEPKVDFFWDLLGAGLPPRKSQTAGGMEDTESTNHRGEHKDMFSRAIETMQDMTMETKRHMLASMMFSIPMAAVTMAAVGVPHLVIAPLATVIPGFMFAAFTDVNHHPERDGTGHGGHGHHSPGHGAHDHHSPDVPQTIRSGNDTAVDHPPPRRTGLHGLLSTIRDFSANRRQNQTLHIRTNQPIGHHIG